MSVDLSIVTISYNQAEYLGAALTSVLEQQDVALEVIVVDPGSSDGSREIAQAFAQADSRVRLVFERDSGQADGLNKGLARAAGRFFVCLNSDDYFLAHALPKAVRLLTSMDADVIVGHGYKEWPDGRRELVVSDRFTPRRYVYGRSNALHQSTFYRVDAVRRAAVSFNVDNKTCWDGEYLLDLSLAGLDIRTVPELFGVFRIHDSSITGSGRMEAAYDLDRARLFAKVMGRRMTRADDLVGLFAGKGQALTRRLRTPVRLMQPGAEP